MKYFFYIVLVLLAACEPSNETLEGDIDRTEQPITLTVTAFETKAELHSRYRAITATAADPDLEGFAQWPEETDSPWCNVFVVAVKKEGDDNMTSLGHEVWHCLKGRFHE